MIISIRIALAICFFANAILQLNTTSASRIQAKRKVFQWAASLDRSTGVASSWEQSYVSIALTKSPQYHSTSSHPTLPSRQEIYDFANEIFSDYPRYLGKRSVTLGLCCVSTSSEKSQSFNLQSTIVGIDVLIFGLPRIRRTGLENVCGVEVKAIGGNVICCVEIPILGGYLANATSSMSGGIDFGCLRFTWVELEPSEHKKTKSRNPRPNIIIVTEIDGNYRPTLAGKNLPIPWWRKQFYCSTQRVIHAYVMWRYHGFVVKEFEKRFWQSQV
ncbi:hypothetical protein ACHAXS_001469 [Conticribra weissflogii]